MRLQFPSICSLALVGLITLTLGGRNAQAQVTIDFEGLYNYAPASVVTNSNGDPIGEALSSTSMWWICLDEEGIDPWQEQVFNLSADPAILHTGVWSSIPSQVDRANIFQSISNIFFNNQALITANPYLNGDSYFDPIFAFQKASWVLIHGFAGGQYTGSFDSNDLAALYLRDSAVEGSLVDDFLQSSYVYNSAGQGQIYFGEAVDPALGLQSVMLISAIPVPEPSGAVLIMASFALLGARRRRL